MSRPADLETIATRTGMTAGIVAQYALDLEDALADLHAEVEMGESVGICLPDRVPSLRAAQLLADVKIL